MGAALIHTGVQADGRTNSLITLRFLFCQQMHLLLNIQNVKIYVKIFYIRSYTFRSIWTILRELTLSLAKVTLFINNQ